MYISMKNKDAPFMCSIRVIHPMSLSRMIFTMTWNDMEVSAVYIIDTISPDAICIVSVNPSMNPIFHMYEIDVGVGRSKSDFFIIFVIGFVFISCFFIRMWLIEFD